MCISWLLLIIIIIIHEFHYSWNCIMHKPWRFYGALSVQKHARTMMVIMMMCEVPTASYSAIKLK